MTDLFKTPDQLFKKYLLSSALDLVQAEFRPYNEILNKMSEDTMKMEYVSSDSNGENEIKVGYLSDPTNQKSKMDLSMTVEGNDYLSVSAIITESIFGIQMKDIHEKYLALENRDLKTFAENIGVDEETSQNIPNQITFSEKFTEEEKDVLKEILTKYVSKINEAINAENYVAEKQIAVNINNQSLTADKYSLIIDEKEFSTLILNTLVELLSDQEFLAVCEGKIDSNSIGKLKQACTDYMADLEKQTTSGEIKLSIYVADKCVKKSEIITESGSTEWFLENTEGASLLSSKNISNKTKTNRVASESTLKIENKYKGSIGTLIIEEKTTYDENDIMDLANDYSSYTTENYENTDIKITISTTNDTNNIKGKITLEGFETEEENNNMTNEFEISFKGELEIEELNSDNSLVLNDYTSADMAALGTELILNALNTANEKPDSLVGELSMFLQFFAPTTDSAEETTNTELDFNTDDTVNIEDNTIAIENNIYEKEDVENYILLGLNQSLTEYKDELAMNENANLGDFLTVENVQEECPSNYMLELIDGTTMKCTIEEQDIYYVTMDINGDGLYVNNLDVYTEQEYLDMQ
ncbi:MAG: hypothetical protein IJW20_06445 [Clostridia bacterium]|nr:hypothetical protein [Clostridia bacterium]